MVADKIRADAEAARIESEWKFAAMVGNDRDKTHTKISVFLMVETLKSGYPSPRP